jgi:hypothetical protein
VSSNHKAPLAAFVVVAIACVVVLATNSMRSYARDAWRSFAAPVIGGLHLNGPAHKPAGPSDAKASTVAAVSDEPAASAASTAAPRGVGKADGATHGKKVKAKPKHGGDQAVVAAVSTPQPTPATPVQAPTASPKPGYGWPLGTRTSWSQGKHLGWSSQTTSAGATATSQWSKQAKHPGRNPWGAGSPAHTKTDRGHGHGWTISDTRSASAKSPWASAPGHGSFGKSGSHSWPGGGSSGKAPSHGSSWGSHRR